MLAPVAFLGSLHVPSGDHPYHSSPLPFEDDDEEAARARVAERRVVPSFRLSNQWVQGEHLFGFFWFDPVPEGEVKRVVIIPLEPNPPHE